MSRSFVLVSAVLVAALALPGAAHACAVCFDGPGETRQAFFATTAFLTVLPLGMLGGAAAWLRKRARQRDVQDQKLPED